MRGPEIEAGFSNLRISMGTQKGPPAADLSDLSREELEEKVRKLSLHVKQLRNVISKSTASADEPVCKKNKKERPFDFSTYVYVHLHFFGLDWRVGL